jgi:hypothetical protein
VYEAKLGVIDTGNPKMCRESAESVALVEGSAVPWIAKSNRRSSKSSLGTFTVALRSPRSVGLNATWNVVLPPGATVDAGYAAKENSPPCVPVV